MSNSKQIEITKKYIGLFIGQGDKKLSTPYGLKHKVEKYTDYFTKEHVYILEKFAIIALEEMGIEIDEEGYIKLTNHDGFCFNRFAYFGNAL